MTRLSLALATLAIALSSTSPAVADYSIIRWSSGDCKIWDNSGWWATPVGPGWSVLAMALPSYDIAKAALEDMYRQQACQ